MVLEQQSISNRPLPFSTLIDLLRWRADHQPDQVIYTFTSDGVTEEDRITYAELDRRARAIAAMLQTAGATGERALLLYPPGIDYIVAFWGCIYAGTVAVPAYPPRLNKSIPALQTIVSDAQAKFALTNTNLLADSGSEFANYAELAALQWLTTAESDRYMEDCWQVPPITGNSLAFLQYTSGSLATPKGVVLTHNNLLHSLALIYQCFQHSHNSRGVIWLPPYHDMGLIGGVLQPLYGGFPVMLMPPVAFLQHPVRWLEAISRSKATTSGGPNFAYDLCVRKVTPEQKAALDLSSWEVAFCGAEPIRPATLNQFAAAFESCGFRREALYPCYGLAEATLIVSGGQKAALPIIRSFDKAALKRNVAVESAPGYTNGQELVSCGHELQDLKITAVRSSTLYGSNTRLYRCAPGEVGEILVSGPSVAQGYWNKPEETHDSFNAFISDIDDASSGPFLRTGDSGFIFDGELFVTGRLKDVIIIRGRNYWPQDIERTVEACHPALRRDAGAAFTIDLQEHERLVVVQEVERQHRAADIDEVAAAVRHAVAAEHGLQVYAVGLIRPGRILKTTSGKIRRAACRIGFLTKSLEIFAQSVLDEAITHEDRDHVALDEIITTDPSTRRQRLEEYLQTQVAKVLRVSPSFVNLTDPVSALGIDSLAAAQLQQQIEADLGIKMPMVRFLQDASLVHLASDILKGLHDATTQHLPLQPVTRGNPLPLAPQQERLWYLDQLYPGNPAYNISTAIRVIGVLNVSILQRSIENVVQRHEVLRTTFASISGRLYQIIADTATIPLENMDLRHVIESDRDAEAQRVAARQIQMPFNLNEGPLLRIALLRLQESKHMLIVTMHHIIGDAWSIAVLVREMVASYSAFKVGEKADLPSLSIQFADVTHWQRQWLESDSVKPSLAFWQDQLVSAKSVLPTEKPRPTAWSFQGANHFFVLPEALVLALRKLAHEEGVTLFMALLGGFEAMLACMFMQNDILVGVPTHGRLHPEASKLIGFFANTLVVRTNIEQNLTYRDILVRVRKATLDAYAHQHVPFAWMVEMARSARNSSFAPLVQVMFSLIQAPIRDIQVPGLVLQPVNIESGLTDFDLFMTLVEEGTELHGSLRYSSALFTPETIEAIVESYRTTLECCSRTPNMPLEQFGLSPAPFLISEVDQKETERLVIVVAATFTAEPLQRPLGFWMEKLNMTTSIGFAPYNQVFQQLLDPESLLSTNRHGINVIIIRFEDWNLGVGNGGVNDCDGAPIFSKIERNAYEFMNALRAAAARSTTPYLVFLCPLSPEALANNDYCKIANRLEAELASQCESIHGVHVITSDRLLTLYPIKLYYDYYGDKAGHIPFTTGFFTAIGTMIARITHNVYTPRHKVIAIDCDNVLWSGICSEDPLKVDIETPHRVLQELLVAQYEAGMFLCVCSKNSEEDVLSVFDHHSEMILRRKHITSWRVNWNQKSENIRSLAMELRLSLDSFIFIDDNPIECAEVQSQCPEVLTLCLPQEATKVAQFIAHCWAFDHLTITDEDRLRTTHYRQSVEREHLRQEAPSLAEFIASLNLKVEISKMKRDNLARVVQLIHRTTQFNVTPQNRSVGVIQQMCISEDRVCDVVKVSDRFGEYGLVGVIIYGLEVDSIEVDTFLLSCRVLGRGVEHQMLAHLGQHAHETKREYIDLKYVPTKRNRPAIDFLNEIGGACEHVADGSILFRVPASAALAVCGPSVKNTAD